MTNSKPIYDLEERTFQFAKRVRLYIKRLLTTILFLLFAMLAANAQEYIMPGETKQVSAENDTLYVITIGQMRDAVEAAKVKEALEAQKELLKNKISLLENQNATLDTLAATHQEDALYYKKSWKTAEEDLQDALKEAKKQRREKYLFGLGGLGLGLLISLL